MKNFWAPIILSILASSWADTKLHPLADEYIEEINKKQSLWKAERNFDKDASWDAILQRVGGTLVDETRKKDNLEIINRDNELVIPQSFDARKYWPNCTSIKMIGDQGTCRSSWAMAATTSMSDRICIHSNATVQTIVSAQDLLTCCYGCGSAVPIDCSGGFADSAWQFWNETGIVSGGFYNTSIGCRAYSYQPCSHYGEGNLTSCSDLLPGYIPTCKQRCDNDSIEYDKDRTYGGKPRYLPPVVAEIQKEIMENGPLEAIFAVYEDFVHYKKGIYSPTSDVRLGNQAVRVLGWGFENNQSYWLAANSWNTAWGENGFFRAAMWTGDIELNAMASVPIL